MAINLTDALNAATTKGKLADAKQIYLEGDNKNLQDAHKDNENHLNTLDTRSTQIEESLKTIAATGGASNANAVIYDNNVSGLTAINVKGALDELTTRFTEIENNVGLYNVDKNIPLGSGYYTSTTARAAIPTAVRKLGLIITYKTDSTTSVTEQFTGSSISSWTTDTNWANVGSAGGNKILEWNTDVATTRKQVTLKERKAGMQISYLHPNYGWVNEQYIGTILNDNEFPYDRNWAATNLLLTCDIYEKNSVKTITGRPFALTVGTSFLVRMVQRNIANNVTLKINSYNALPLYMNGKQVDNENSWDANDLLEIYYDGEKYNAKLYKEFDGYVEWNTDVATTRKSVGYYKRKPGLIIKYKDSNGNWNNEQYVGKLTSDNEWVKNSNWAKVNVYKDGDEKYNIPQRCIPYKYLKDKFVRSNIIENGTGNTAIVFKVEANKTYLIRGFLTPIQDSTLGANTGLYTYFADEDLTQHISNIDYEINVGNYSFVRRYIFKATQDGYLILNNVDGIRTDYVWLYSLPKNENTTALDIQDIEIVNSNKYRKLLPIAQKDNSNIYEMKIDRWYLIRINNKLLSGVYGKSFASWYVDKELTNRINSIVFNTVAVADYYADILINPYNGGKLNSYAYLKFIDDIDKQGIAEIYEVSDYSDYYRAISINCEGDSLTAGLNGNGHTYPKKLKELINQNYEGSNIMISNWGLTGATAQTIAMNAEAMSYSLFEDLVIPAGESKDGKFYDYINKQMMAIPYGQDVYVSIFDKKYQPLKIATPITTIINNTDKEVTYKKGEKIFFRRKREPSSTLVKPKILCIYLGRNDRFEGIATDVAINHMINCIKQMLEHWKPENYVVISQFDFWYSFDNEEKMIQYEDAFEREFNAHFINFRWYARNKWFEYSGLVPTENDKAAMAKGGAPKSIYATNDVIHLGAVGYDFLGTIVFERLIDLGVLPALPSYNMGS